MANQTAGSVTWNLDIDRGKFDTKLAASKADITGFERVLQGAESTVGGFAKSIATVAWDGLKVGAGAAATAMAGLGLKGITSANQLQSLQLSMNGLTHSMTLGAQAMAGAYEFAQKSPFQLPEVAGATKTLIAYGQTAQAAVGNLQTLGNVSITTGVPLEHLAGIFGQVSAQGSLMLGDIRQLTENGVAILPALQKEFGKTAQQVQDMASAGQISFDQFNRALSSMVDPSILDQLNNTLPRQIDRLKGSVRQLSNAFVGVSVDAQNGFKMASDGLAQAATNLVKNVADQLRSPEIKTAFASIGTQVVPVINQVSALIQPLVGTVIAIAQPLATLLTGSIGGIVTLLTAALPGLNAFFAALNTGFQALVPVFSSVGQILGAGLSQILAALAPAIQPLLQALGIIAPLIADIISDVAVFIAQLVAGLAPILPPLAEALVEIVRPLLKGLAPLLPIIVNLVGILANALVQVLQAILPIIPPLVDLAVTIFQQVLIPILPVLVQLLTLLANVIVRIATALLPSVPLFVNLVKVLVSGLAPILPLLATLVLQLVQALLPLLPALVNLAVVLLPPLVSLLTVWTQLLVFVANILVAILGPALSIVIQSIGLLVGVFVAVIHGVQDFAREMGGAVQRILDAVSSRISQVTDTFRQLPARIVGFIGNVGRTLFDIGRDLVQGLLDGAESLLKTVGRFFIDKLPSFIREPFKKALGIHSPSTVFAGYGKNLVEGLVNGIDASQDIVGNAVRGLGSQLGLDTTLNIGRASGTSGAVIGDSLTSIGARSPSDTSSKVEIHLHQDGIVARSRAEFRDIMEDGIEAINERLRSRRLPEIGGGALSGGRSTAA